MQLPTMVVFSFLNASFLPAVYCTLNTLLLSYGFPPILHLLPHLLLGKSPFPAFQIVDLPLFSTLLPTPRLLFFILQMCLSHLPPPHNFLDHFSSWLPHFLSCIVSTFTASDFNIPAEQFLSSGTSSFLALSSRFCCALDN